RLVLLQKRLRQLAQRHLGPVQRPQSHLAERLLEDLARLRLRAEARQLRPVAVSVAIADRPQPARLAEDLAALSAHAAPPSSRAVQARRASSALCSARPFHAASTSLHKNRTGRTRPASLRPGIIPSR